MGANEKKFIFEKYHFDLKEKEIKFYYLLQTPEKIYRFIEKLFLPAVISSSAPVLRTVLDNLFLILGISYWKLFCPSSIEILPFRLSKPQADFWNTVYTKGLGEFFYKNKIDFRGLVRFPFSVSEKPKPVRIFRKGRSLLMLGGGKDSIVAGELLKKKKKTFDLFILNPVPLQKKVGELLNRDIIFIKRILDPKLPQLNAGGAYNGHVPVSAIYAFTGLLAACLYDYKQIVAANEKSANYGNIKYLGGMINHQWSKSAEFEDLFQKYVYKFITPDIIYYSLLRPYGEIEIVKMFSKYPQYFNVFSSCNTNFRLSKSDFNSGRWCGRCPKCAFVFAALSAYLEKNEVIKIFDKNMLADKTLIPVYKELLGFKNHKPFECVGTPQETKKAFQIIAKRKEFDDDPVIKMYFRGFASMSGDGS